MKTTRGNILNPHNIKTYDAICFTSNGIVKNNGALVMGAGVAKAFRDRFNGIDNIFGKIVSCYGNHVWVVKHSKLNIVSFPTKHHWRNASDLRLIKRSAEELMLAIENNKWNNVALPRPGCSNGGLHWTDVTKVISNILDDRVTVISL